MALLNNKGASSSFSSARRWNYDVFLSFRGEDTREGFTNHLYKALCNKGLRTFIDDKLPRGEEISVELIQTIKNSSILVIVFSENYAESKWCLDELAEIVDCREKDPEVQIRPIFYNVDPSEIRNQKGNFGIALANHEMKFNNNKDKVQRWRDALRKAANAFGWHYKKGYQNQKGNFGIALANHEMKFKNSKDKVQRWRDALRKAANASGWHYKKGCSTYISESLFIQNIVEEISNAAKLHWTPLHVADYPVGIHSRAKAIESLLDIGLDEFCVVGIHGLPGVGKTTIAKAVYNKIVKHFDGSSFLMNVRESVGTDVGIVTLQEQLLNDILVDGEWRVGNKSSGISLIEKRLCCKKVLLVLDDVDDLTGIKNLLGKCNWFFPGSRVILTLRDRCLLDALKEKLCTSYKVKEFEVELLNEHEALQLFEDHAFSGNKPHDEDYSKLATKFIDFAKGLPLALEIIASDLCGKAKDEWESALDVYNKIPNKKIQNILRVSYDGLYDTEKYIFLDIACFFKGWNKDYVVKILDACELFPGFGIPRLVSKCLITVSKFGTLSMHDLIQQMGKEVVRQQAPDILRKRSRLCCYKDSLNVLTTDKGSKNIRGIMLHSPRLVEEQLHTEAFRKMENLKFLIVENVRICKPYEFLPKNLVLLKWSHYPFHWPSEYFPEQLVAIEMPHSHIRFPKLIKQEWRLKNLKDVNLMNCEFIKILPKLCAPNLENLNLHGCKNLVKLPKLWAPNLNYLELSYCENLVEIDEYFGSLEKLKSWDLFNCQKLQILPSQLRLKSLYSFDLRGCSSLEKLPNFHQEMECLGCLYLSSSGIREVPSSIEHLTKLRELVLSFCKNLRDLPDGICKLQELEVLHTSTTKLRLTCNSFDSSSEGNEAKIELDLLMNPNYFPNLTNIYLCEANIVTIPESISRFPKLKYISFKKCKLQREIQVGVDAEGCMLLDTQSASGLLSQLIEIIGISPNRVCGSARSTNCFPSESEDGDISMDRQFSNHLPFETEGVEYEDRCIPFNVIISGTKMPKWFNHQTVENSIYFCVGRKFPKLAVCIAYGGGRFRASVYISINGYEKRHYAVIFMIESGPILHLVSPSQRFLQVHLNESNPTDQNHVEVTYSIYNGGCDIKRWGVHVECTCLPAEHGDDDDDDNDDNC